MAEIGDAILGWAIPALVVFGVAAIAIAVIVWAVRAARRSPRARAAADARARAGGCRPRAARRRRRRARPRGRPLGRALRRRRTGIPPSRADDRPARAGRRVRGVPRDLRDRTPSPDEIRRVVGAHRATQHRSARDDRARRAPSTRSGCGRTSRRRRRSPPPGTRLDALRASDGRSRRRSSPSSPSRFAEEEWRMPRGPRARPSTAQTRPSGHLDGGGAERRRPDPHARSPNSPRRERSLRRAETDARILEETHRLVTQAAQAVPGEFDAARTALRQAIATRESSSPADARAAGRRAARRSTPS